MQANKTYLKVHVQHFQAAISEKPFAQTYQQNKVPKGSKESAERHWFREAICKYCNNQDQKRALNNALAGSPSHTAYLSSMGHVPNPSMMMPSCRAISRTRACIMDMA